MNRRNFLSVLSGIVAAVAIPLRIVYYQKPIISPKCFLDYRLDENGFATLRRWGTWNYKELGFEGQPKMEVPKGFKRMSICCTIPKDETKATWETIDREVLRSV